jgi:NADPH-dependent glutamate synthase beta subunit-like oxidoreductase
VIGGAVAGAEVAGALAEQGVEVVVIEQNPRPYGKIEDGLPRWHVALRNKEYEAIGERLSLPGVHFLPKTRVGRDVGFAELAREWGFSGVVLACGAWRDRPLPVDGADAYLDKGLIYQNPFIIWFNHAEDPNYSGPRFTPQDGAIVLGGGLASIDVAKALMIETTRQKLRERGIEVPMLELEVKGIPKILAGHGLKFEDLGLTGCTIYYRRREEDMPLAEIPDGATPERAQKVLGSRKKLLEKAMEKFGFKVEALCTPEKLIVENGRLAGLGFRRTRAENGKIIPTDETFERRGCYVISSIGSIPEPIEGIPMKGELFAFSDWDMGRLPDYPTVFSAGNVVTGKGNIVASRKHARALSEKITAAFLGIGEGHAGEEAGSQVIHESARAEGLAIAAEIKRQPQIGADALARIRQRVKEHQSRAGYPGDYHKWLEKVPPPN